ncbi:MAG: hypothetical protein F7C07_04650 [Desulfurococcales archaeon]|nr:hypothetical protein [Desulfurococcales archaeon]
MRGLLQHSLEKIAWRLSPRAIAHMSYIVNRNSGIYLGTGLGAALPLAIFMTLVYPPELEILLVLVLFMSFLVSILVGFMASQAAGELESGETLLYLSTPLSKSEYYYSWIFSTTIMFTAIYTLGFAVPLLIVAPRALAVWEIVSILVAVIGQLIYHSVIFSSAALVLKTRTRIIGLIIGFLLVLPIATVVTLAVLDAIDVIDVTSDTVEMTLMAYYPALVLFLEDAIVTWEGLLKEVVLVSVVSAVTLAVSRWYVRNRMEV